MGRRTICVLSAALLAMMSAACSNSESADPPTKSEQIAAGLDGLARGARLPLKPVHDGRAPTRNGVSLNAVANGLPGVKYLESVDNPNCVSDGGGIIYTVTGDADDLWRRLTRRSSDTKLRMAQASSDGRQLRYLYQIGDDWIAEVALTQGPQGTVLATLACG